MPTPPTLPQESDSKSPSIEGGRMCGEETTPLPWVDAMFPPVQAGDGRVLINGRPPQVSTRILSEPNFQIAKAALNLNAPKTTPFEPELTLTTCASCGNDPRPSEVIVREDRDLEAPDEPAEPAPVKMLHYEPAGQAQGWMTVGLGTRFDPLDPKPEDINVADIARALSRLPRYGGHGHRVMSVAEHCVLLTEWVEKVASGADLDVSPDEMLAVLHHDDEEAYICDMPRPIKHGVPGLLAIYEALADKILDAIHAHLGIERWEKTAIYDLAKDLDRRVVFAELPALFSTDPEWQPGDAEGYEPEFWGDEEAERRFLAAHEAWGGTVPASPERAES